jgi:predicted DNA-binding transcriptional regulator AlpA
MQTNTPIVPPLRTNDLVALFGIPEPTWRGWRHEGRGPRYYKLGGIVMYDQSDIQAWLEEQRASTGQRERLGVRAVQPAPGTSTAPFTS